MAIVWIGRIVEPYRPRRPQPQRGPSPVNKTGEAMPVEARGGHVSDLAGNQSGGPDAIRRDPYAPPPPSQFKPALKVAQLMSEDVVTIREDSSANLAWRLMLDRHIRHLPVLDREGRVSGILSDRDLLRGPGSLEGANLMAVSELMTRKVLAARPEAHIRDVAGAMAAEHIHCFPVIDNNHKLRGIITSSDILHCLVNRDPLDLWV